MRGKLIMQFVKFDDHTGQQDLRNQQERNNNIDGHDRFEPVRDIQSQYIGKTSCGEKYDPVRKGHSPDLQDGIPYDNKKEHLDCGKQEKEGHLGQADTMSGSGAERTPWPGSSGP